MHDKQTVVRFRKHQDIQGQNFMREVFEQHHKALLQFVGRLGIDEQKRHDVVQEVYLRIARQGDPEKLKYTPRSYLYMIATLMGSDRSKLLKSK